MTRTSDNGQGKAHSVVFKPGMKHTSNIQHILKGPKWVILLFLLWIGMLTALHTSFLFKMLFALTHGAQTTHQPISSF